jgi:hypothetical protein
MAWAYRHCGTADDGEMKERLPPNDWQILLIGQLTGGMENSGSFADAAGSFPEYRADLEAALTRSGCPKCAGLVKDCIALKEDYAAADAWNDDFEARAQKIDEEEDWSYEGLVGYLMNHDSDFSFSILPYREGKPGD